VCLPGPAATLLPATQPLCYLLLLLAAAVPAAASLVHVWHVCAASQAAADHPLHHVAVINLLPKYNRSTVWRASKQQAAVSNKQLAGMRAEAHPPTHTHLSSASSRCVNSLGIGSAPSRSNTGGSQ
jgi:hypothetical protein